MLGDLRRLSVPCDHLLGTFPVQKGCEFASITHLTAVKLQVIGRITNARPSLLLCCASFPIVLVTRDMVLILWPWNRNAFRTRRVPTIVHMDRFEVELAEFSVVRLEDHFLALDRRELCVSPLIADLAEYLLHHLNLPVVIDWLIVELVPHSWF